MFRRRGVFGVSPQRDYTGEVAARPIGTGESEEGARETLVEPLGRPRREQTLPWDISSIRYIPRTRLAAVGFDPVIVCGKGAATSISPAAGTNATARTRNACGSCGVGRLPSGNNSGGPTPKCCRPMRQRSDNGGLAVVKNAVWRVRKCLQRQPMGRFRAARGHAAKVFRLLFAIDPAATKRYVSPAISTLVTVAMIAGRP